MTEVLPSSISDEVEFHNLSVGALIGLHWNDARWRYVGNPPSCFPRSRIDDAAWPWKARLGFVHKANDLLMSKSIFHV